MKKIFLLLVILGLFISFNSIAKDSNGFVKSEKGVYKTGLLFKDPRTNPRARRVLKVYPAKGAVNYGKANATSCDNTGFLPPVRSQGGQGSCTAWAVGYYFKSYQENKEANRTDAGERASSANICSPAFLYNLIHAKGDNGSYFGDAFNVLNTLGCCSLSKMPYDDSDYTTWPSTDAFKDAMARKTIMPNNGYDFNYIALDSDADLDQVKQLLLNGHVVVFGINVYDNYYNISDYNNIYALADKTGSDHGGHAQCIVGFDDTIDTPDGQGAFRVVNSWGTGWGDNGFYWISYKAIKSDSDYSHGYVFWVEDRINYNPEYYVLMNITHPYSRETKPYIKTSTGNRLDLFDFHVNEKDYEYNPYPTTDIAVDVSDLNPSAADYITLYVKDVSDVSNGKGGTINKFSYITIATGEEKVSNETPVDFADNETGSATVYFSGSDYTITATAHAGGTIDPSGDVIVHEGTSKTFSIEPDYDYHILDVKVDGNSVGPVDSYTFENVTSDHTIDAYFEKNQEKYKITATSTEGGSIDPSGDVIVDRHSDQTFLITPNEGYFINDVVVDSKSVGRVGEYTFENVLSSHTIHAIFTTSLPPEITEASTRMSSGNAPLSVKFSCQAHDPDGGSIVKYEWIIEGDKEDKVVTYTNTCNYTFTNVGSYKVKVKVFDDEGETAEKTLNASSGEQAIIVVHQPSELNMPVPVSVYSGKNKSEFVSSETVFLNPFLQEVNIAIKFYDSDLNLVATLNKIIAPHSKFVFTPDNFDVEGYSDVVVQSDNYLIVYNKSDLQNGMTTAYLLPQYSGKLFVPHIAEETDYWDTSVFLSNISPSSDNGIRVKVDSNEASTSSNSYISMLDMESFLPENLGEGKGWGSVETFSSNPFVSSPKSLNGFEVFVHNNTDGAAVELVSGGGTTLFIPHIPEETDIFWTGFAILNPESSDASATFYFYTDNGDLVGQKTLTVPAGAKIKGTVKDLFPDVFGKANWGVVKSDKNLVGIEIYGTNDSGICGYNLPFLALTDAVLPFVITGEGNWSGIALTNPGNETAHVAIQLISKDGQIKTEKTVTIEAGHRFKSVVSEFFSGTQIERGDYIRYISSDPVVGIIVNGDNARTFMTALVGTK